VQVILRYVSAGTFMSYNSTKKKRKITTGVQFCFHFSYSGNGKEALSHSRKVLWTLFRDFKVVNDLLMGYLIITNLHFKTGARGEWYFTITYADIALCCEAGSCLPNWLLVRYRCSMASRNTDLLDRKIPRLWYLCIYQECTEGRCYKQSSVSAAPINVISL